MSCCQYVSLQQLVILVDRLRTAALTPDERSEHERFLGKCVAYPDALAFVYAPESHAANPHPGASLSADEIARTLLTLR